MALPKLNDTPKYQMVVPSTGKTVRYRPYLVKEEKILMMAFEGGDVKQSLSAVADVIICCLEENSGVQKNKLTTFDVEYMFTQIRAKSVGELSDILIACRGTECKHKSPVKVDLEKVRVTGLDKSTIIELTPEISVQMTYPSYKLILTKDLDQLETNPEMIYDLIVDCIEAILTEDNRILAKDESREELVNFVESFTSSQSNKMQQFFSDIPTMQQEITFNCEKCLKENQITLSGMSDFF